MLLTSIAETGENRVLVTLFVMWVAAKLMAELFERLGQPAVVGEIVGGMIIGPGVLGWAMPNEITSTLAEIGAIFLLFTVGLETRPTDLARVGRKALVVATLGVIVPFVCGYLLMRLWGSGTIESLFIGTAMVATSVGITARVLGQMGLLDDDMSRIILGAAVIDDILGLLILAIVSSIAHGSVDYLEIFLIAGQAVGFTLFVALLGAPFITRIAPRIAALRLEHSFFVVGLALCLGLSVAVGYIGMAAIIGAFLAGMALAEATADQHTMHKQMSGVAEFLVPFFLAGIGMQLKLDAFRDTSVITLIVLVTIVAVITKLIGGGAAVISLGWRRAAQVGMGMVPRGEVGIVVAQIGLGMAVITDALFGIVVFMSIATTLIAPPFLKMLFANAGGQVAEDSG